MVLETRSPDYDITVIGAGLFGSAAAKYISVENKHLRVALIGPSEPKDKRDSTIHGAHYDEGRIYRSADKDVIWGTAAKRSYDQFRNIERQSGLKIYTDVGYLSVGPPTSRLIKNLKANAERTNEKLMFFENADEIKNTFPYMEMGPEVQGVLLPEHSGHMNPRNLVKAQVSIAQEAGCHYIDDVVDSLQPNTSHLHFSYTLTLAKGGQLTSGKVLLATGSFTHCRNLLPPGIMPDMEMHPDTVILIEVDEDERTMLENMPCMVYKGGKWDKPDLNIVAYILPPIQYPDGKYYLKIGHGHNEPHLLHTPEEITRWYHDGNEPTINNFLVDVGKSLFPKLGMQRYKFDYCVTTDTPKGYPYVDLIRPELGVAIGGCGQGAKSSDEFGKMAASMITRGHWHHDFPERAFKFKSLRTLCRPSKL